MSIEVNHLIIPATDKQASARFLAGILGLEPDASMSHFQPVRVGHVTLDYDDATDIRPLHIAFLVDDKTFDAAHRRLTDAHVATYADPRRTQPERSTAARAAEASTSTTPTCTSSSSSPPPMPSRKCKSRCFAFFSGGQGYLDLSTTECQE
jgi:hypothetical protein